MNHVNIAIILQYGHGTRNGGYVQGVDYINPALKPVFDRLAKRCLEGGHWIMGKVVEDDVVRMQFENGQFEKKSVKVKNL